MRKLPAALLAPLLASLSSCGVDSAPTEQVVIIGAPDDPFSRGIRLTLAGQLVRAATAEGLVGLDEQGRVIPAIADRWIVTDDGLSYIFRLRDGTWPDGTEITGETARRALNAALGELAGTSLAQEVMPIDDIRAMAGRVLEIRLRRAVPELLQLLAQPELGLMRSAGAGAGGAMSLHRSGAVALLTPTPPARLGMPQPEDWREHQRSIALRALPADVATEWFSDGKTDIVLGGRFQDLPQAQAVAGLARRPLKLDPAPGLFGLAFTTTRAWLIQPECREALAMAIDRDAIGAALGLGNWSGTTVIVPPPPGAASAERWADRTLAQRQSEAAARISRCKARNGDPGPLRLALPEGPGSDALHARLAGDLGLVGIALARVPERTRSDLRLIDMVARYPRAEWYLHQLSCAGLRGPCSAAADALLAQMEEVGDPAKAPQLVAEAAAAVTAANVYVPLGAPVRWSLVRDRVNGFFPNAAAFHPLPPLAVVAQ
ncbi:MAG TPA: ABC transporter substrate-binding protein [Novosphingobium sp.]|nr:ABC transporter substrate-binding protein [Novosphingobium sp.]